LEATVAATTAFTAATASAQSFTVGAATATVAISNLSSSDLAGGAFTPSITTTGDGTVFSVSSSTMSVCVASGAAVTFVDAGTCSFTFSVAATTDYLRASNATSITVKSIPKKAITRTSLTLTRSRVAYGAEHSVTIVVHVTSSSSIRRLGTVKIMAGGRLLSVATINRHGVAKCALTAKELGRGTYRIDTAYEGTAFNTKSASNAARLHVG
jgi:hypothetical protein